MRYLVKARLRPEKRNELIEAIEENQLGRGSVAFGEYERNMREARLSDPGVVKWVEICYCDTPLEEEIPYWEPFFEIEQVSDAHARRNCRHENGTEQWACDQCDCTEKLEAKLEAKLDEEGVSFLESLYRSRFD